MNIHAKEYLGDSVYVEFDGWGIILTTENGFGASNTIVLEPEVYMALKNYADRLDEALKAKYHKEAESI